MLRFVRYIGMNTQSECKLLLSLFLYQLTVWYKSILGWDLEIKDDRQTQNDTHSTLTQMSKNTPDYLLLESLCHLLARWWLGTGCHGQHTRGKDDFQQGLPGQEAGLVWRWAGLWEKDEKRNITASKSRFSPHTWAVIEKLRVASKHTTEKNLVTIRLTFKKWIKRVQLTEPSTTDKLERDA